MTPSQKICGRLGDPSLPLKMDRNVAIIGAGVSGLTCGIVFAEHGYRTAIFAKETGRQTTSGAAAAIWFPYHVEPAERVIPLALDSYQVLLDLARFPESGVSIIESRQFLRTGEIEIPDWAIPLGASAIPSEVGGSRRAGFNVSPRDPSTPPARAGSAHDEHCFASGFSLRVPLMDTTIYLDYLTARFGKASRGNPRERPLQKTRRCRCKVRPRDRLRRNRRARACE